MAASMKLRACRSAGLLLAAALGVAPVATMAQLEEIIVTAQKREQSLQDVSGTVNVYSGQDLDKLAAFQLSDLSKVSAGLVMPNATFSNVSWIVIRGFGSISVSGQQQATAVFINGGVQSDASSALSGLLDVERVEVLRGPQGTLYGKNAPTGAINIWTRRPDLEEFGGEVGFMVSENSEYRGETILNLPVSDSFGMRLAAQKHESDSYIDNVYLNEDAIDFDREQIQATLLWVPADTVELNLYARKLKTDSANILTSLFDYPEEGDDIYDFEVSQNDRGYGKQDDEAYVLNVAWEFAEGWTLESVTAYEEYENDYAQDRDARADVPDIAIFDQELETFSQELRVNFSNDRWDLMFGAFYSDFDQWSDVTALLGGGIALTEVIDGYTSFENESVFTNNTYRFTDKWSLTVGARFSEDPRKSSGLQLIRVDGLSQFDRDVDLKTRGTNDKSSYSVKLTYQPTDDITTYLAYDTAYRLGGRNVLVSPVFWDAGFRRYPDEDSDAWELGLKSLFLDSRLSLTTAVYFQTYDNFHIGTFSPGYQLGEGGPVIPDTSRINAPADNAEAWGFEIESVFAPDEHWRFSGNLSYNSIKINGYLGPGIVDSGPIIDGIVQRTRDGEQLGQAPQTIANATAAYSDTFSNGMRWTTRALASFSGSVNNDAYDAQSHKITDDYIVFETFFDLESANQDWVASLWVKNLLDEEYIVGGWSTLDDGGGIPGAPRAFGLSGRYRF